MLVITRAKEERLLIGDDIEVVVLDVRGPKVRLGIRAPKDVAVDRPEIRDRKNRNRRAGETPAGEQDREQREDGAA